MVSVENLKTIHLEFISWLNSKDSIQNINDYIAYVEDKLDLYEKYSNSQDFRVLKGLSRSLNRYRDEFKFDLESINQSYLFFNRMDEEVKRIESTQES
jgi:hypothetical protein